MTLNDIAIQRLHRQQLLHTSYKSPKEIVSHLGAMQAQDYAMAKWAIGLRLPGSTDDSIEMALDRGEIIRTHILRPTWHFVAAEDLRWMMQLTAPHVQRLVATYQRKLGLTDEILRKSDRKIEQLLEGKQLTREEIMLELQQMGIPTDEIRATLLMFSVELQGIVCNGSRRGKQNTYALVEERIPPGKALTREEALYTLSAQYFTGHGPATLQDYAWWSGLSMTDIRRGLEMIKPLVEVIKIEDKEYRFVPPPAKASSSGTEIAHFLPAFDEFMIGYTDRSASLEGQHSKITITANGIFKPVIALNGIVRGTWKRTLKKDKVLLEIQWFSTPPAIAKELLEKAAQPFGEFLNLPVMLSEVVNA